MTLATVSPHAGACEVTQSPSPLPLPSYHRRGLFGTLTNDRCTMRDFDSRMAAATAACCATGTGQCATIPRQCTYACSQVMPAFVSECKQLIAAMAPKQTTKFADVSSAVISLQTKGVLGDCATAKTTHLCERDPAEVKIFCPVTCTLGCGASTGKVDAFDGLQEACKHLPATEIIDAIAQAYCPHL